MDYITAEQAAGLWGVRRRIVQKYCAEGRVDGAFKLSRDWLIPRGTAKPHDLRASVQRGGQQPARGLPKHCGFLLCTSLYSEPGSADALAESCRPADPDAARAIVMNAAYFRGRHGEAARLAREVPLEGAGAYLRFNVCQILALDAMFEGDAGKWLEARKLLLNTDRSTEGDYALCEYHLAVMDSAIFDKQNFPGWLKAGCFDLLPVDSYPIARFTYLKWLYMNGDKAGLSAAAEPLISQTRAEGALLPEIYLRIMAAVNYHETACDQQARTHLQKALALALPDGFYSPFAEYRRQLGPLLDSVLREAGPSALRSVVQIYNQLIPGWTKLFNALYDKKLTLELTLREYETAAAVCGGLTNAEAAARLGISVNAVKLYLRTIYEKLGVHSRAELKPYIYGEP